MIKTTAMLCDELRGYANPLAKISRMMRSGELTPLIKGLYETDASVPGHYLAGVIYGPSYLSFEFALAWHGLIPEAVYSYTSATCGKGRKKRYDTAFGTFLFRDIPVAVFPYGTQLHIENGYGFVIASPEKAICDQLYTFSPCNNRASLQRLLFEDLRIEPTMFTNLDMNALAELAGLYNTKNHKMLISLAKDVKRHEWVDGGVHVRRYLDVVTGHRS